MSDIVSVNDVKDVCRDNIATIVSKIVKILKNRVEKHKVITRKAFDEYYENVIKKTEHCKIFITGTADLCFQDIYVNVSISNKNSKEIVSTENIRELTEVSKRILLAGTGGLGKSTLLRHLFLSAVQNGDRIPIFIELRDVNEMDKNTDIYQLIYDNIARYNFDYSKEVLTGLYECGECIFFFDAYDEVYEEKRRNILRGIGRLIEKYPDNVYIVSSRELANAYEFGEWDFFDIFYLNKLKEYQAIELVKKIPYDETIKEKFIGKLRSDYFKDFRSFAEIPLFLQIMLIIFQEHGDIPKKMHLFYEQAYQNMYDIHDGKNKSAFSRKKYCKLDIYDMKKFLSVFSYISYRQGKLKYTKDELHSIIIKSLEWYKFEEKADDVAKDLIECLCLLKNESGYYVFCHKNFQEYFSAVFILARKENDMRKILNELLDKMPESLFEDNIFNMLVEMEGQRVEETFIFPYIEELQKKYQYNSHDDSKASFVKFIRSNYSKAEKIKKGQKSRWILRTKTKGRSKEVYFMDAIYKAYQKEYQMTLNKKISSADFEKKLRLFCTKNHKECRNSIDFSEFDEKELQFLRKELCGVFNKRYSKLVYLFKLKNILEEKGKNRLSIDELLKFD